MALGVPARENENGRLKSDDIKEHLQRFGYEELAPRLFVKDLKKRLQTKANALRPSEDSGKDAFGELVASFKVLCTYMQQRKSDSIDWENDLNPFMKRESEKFDNRTSNKSIENRPEVDDAFTTLGYDIAKRIEGLNTEGVKERLVTKVNSLPPGKTEELVRYLNAFDTVYNVIREDRPNAYRGAYKKIKDFLTEVELQYERR